MAESGSLVTDGPRPRLHACVERWPECEEGAYDPRCCRFPKSCSCTVYDDQDELEPFFGLWQPTVNEEVEGD